ncbi:hypothetical protein [Streptomyces sp. NPDC057429]|uniref:hypothetical protein n=1 Tax=Streptomyces sp. NPDC057429 TaxID=3346130 RepID=UPI0036A32B11
MPGLGAAHDFLGGFFLRFEERGDRFGAQVGLLLADGAVGEQVGAALAWEVGEGGAGDASCDGHGVRASAASLSRARELVGELSHDALVGTLSEMEFLKARLLMRGVPANVDR